MKKAKQPPMAPLRAITLCRGSPGQVAPNKLLPSRRSMFQRQPTCCTAATLTLLAVLIALTGCASSALEHRPPAETAFVPGYPPEKVPVGRELDKVSLPPYTIEPPDILTIEAT